MGTTLKIFLHDPSKGSKQDSNKLIPNVDCRNVSLRRLFEDACSQRLFPSGAMIMGLHQDEPVQIHSTDLDKTNRQVTSLGQTFLDVSIENVFENFDVVTLIEFRLNERQLHTPTTSAVGIKRNMQSSTELFDVFLTQQDRKKKMVSELTKQMEGIETPMSREEFKKGEGLTAPTPNFDQAYDHVKDWLVDVFELRCCPSVRMNTKHMLYSFIEYFALLLLQVGCSYTHYGCTCFLEISIPIQLF